MVLLHRIIFFLLVVSIMPAYGAKNIYTGWFSNKAVSGYDSVAYFTQGKAVKGNARFVHKFQNVEWHFSSPENMDMFVKNPQKYMPQYGGYCAWAVAAKKQRAPGDPNYWTIVDGKLYLNYDASVQEKWLKDVPGFIKKANQNWPEMQ